jgi:flagellar operon protein
VINTIDRIGSGVLPVAGGPGDTSRLTDAGPLGGSSLVSTPALPATSGGKSGIDFRDALAAAADERSLQFSEHALKRVDQRQIPLAGDQLDRLQKAMDTLSQRGSRQSLVMLDQVAYVVHVPSHTVVTAVGSDQNKERVFTQIDSVVIA